MEGNALQLRNKRPEPLAQIELLVLFHPLMQSGGHRVPAETCAKATQAWLTVDVHGRIARGELTGERTIEDMRLESNGEDVSALLEPLADEIANYIVKE